jgi:glyoxylase-like metal-dependent hydrolase (beta-lactamase superfamily II)
MLGIDMRPIVPGVYPIPGLKTGRSYLLAASDGLALVDSSSTGRAERIIAAIEAIGRRPSELHLIFATHYHHDHTGNVAELSRRTGAELWVHADDAPYVDGRIPWERTAGVVYSLADRFLPAPYTLPVDHEMREGDTFPALGGLSVVHLPGHTPGNSGLYAAAHGIIFTGDALMNVLGLRLPLAAATHDIALAHASVRKLAGYEFEHALPGHGAPILSRASEKIREWSERWLAPETTADAPA